MKHNVLLCGLGQIGLGYDLGQAIDDATQTHARAFAQHPSFELIAAVDPDPTKRSACKNSYGTPVYASLAEVPRTATPTVFAIATDTESHAELFFEGIELFPSIKACLCEKPLHSDLATARQMCDAATARSLLTGVNYIRRSLPGFQQCGEIIQSGELGRCTAGLVLYSNGVLNNASHFVELTTSWLGEPKRAAATANQMPRNSWDIDCDFELDYEDSRISFKVHPTEQTVQLTFERGRVHFVGDGEYCFVERATGEKQQLATNILHYQYEVASELSEALSKGVQMRSNFLTALKVLEILEPVRRGK